MPADKDCDFVLQQKTADTWTLIQAGSRFLSDAETRYAVIELEMLAVVWSVTKCRVFLASLQHFTHMVLLKGNVTLASNFSQVNCFPRLSHEHSVHSE